MVDADGLAGLQSIDVSSDAALTGLNTVDLASSAASTSGDSSTATSSTLLPFKVLNSVLPPPSVALAPIGGQVDFSGSADAANVTGNALGNGTLGSAQGLVTGEAASGFGTSISSDGTLQGFAINSISSDAATTNGVAGANTTITSIDGANLGDVSIGGVGSLLGQSSLTGSAAASNVEGGSSTAQNSLGDADGLDATSSLQISSDGSISGLNNGSLAASAESTGVTGATTTAQASSSAGTLKGAVLGTDASGASITEGQPIQGVINSSGDTDWYAANLNAGETYEIKRQSILG